MSQKRGPCADPACKAKRNFTPARSRSGDRWLCIKHGGVDTRGGRRSVKSADDLAEPPRQPEVLSESSSDGDHDQGDQVSADDLPSELICASSETGLIVLPPSFQ
eukprot:9581945-Karenia_brevis.AAC.1